jgi:hypothetical protein
MKKQIPFKDYLASLVHTNGAHTKINNTVITQKVLNNKVVVEALEHEDVPPIVKNKKSPLQ